MTNDDEDGCRIVASPTFERALDVKARLREEASAASKRAEAVERQLKEAQETIAALKSDNAALLTQLTKAASGHNTRIFWDDTDALTRQPHPGAALLTEVATLRAQHLQAEADRHAVHAELSWAGEFPLNMPPPSRAITALLKEHRKALETAKQALKSQQAESHTLRRAFLHERHRAEAAGASESHAYKAAWADALLSDERKALVRARNEGLETAAAVADDAFSYVKVRAPSDPSLGMPEQIAARIRALKESEQ